MGSVLQRRSDGVHSSSRTERAPQQCPSIPSPLTSQLSLQDDSCEGPSLQTSLCWQQENQGISLKDNLGGFPLTHEQRARMYRQKAMALARRDAKNSLVQNITACTEQSNHGFSFWPVQNSASALCSPQGKQGGFSLTPEQRARIDSQKATALARRRARLDQQHHEELLFNRLTAVQSTPSSEQDNHVSMPEQRKQGILSLTPEQRARMDQQKGVALTRRKLRLEQQCHVELLLDCIQSTSSSQQDNHVSIPEKSKQGVLSLTQEQRACMDSQKLMALNRRKVRLKQQHVEELLLNQLTHAQSSLSCQHDSHVSIPLRSTISMQQDNYSGFALASANSSLFSQQAVHSGSAHMQGNTCDFVYSALLSQQDNHGSAALTSLQSPLALQQDDYGGSALLSVENPLSLQHGNHVGTALASLHGFLSSQQSNYNSCVIGSVYCAQSLQHDDYVGSSLTIEQREVEALAACRGKLEHIKQEQDIDEPWVSQCDYAGSAVTFKQREEEALVRRRGKLEHIKQEKDLDEPWVSQCTIGCTAKKHEDGDSSLTSAQKARIAQQKEVALARRNKRLHQLQQGEQPTTQWSSDTIIRSSPQPAGSVTVM